jgi:hypothetical protein
LTAFVVHLARILNGSVIWNGTARTAINTPVEMNMTGMRFMDSRCINCGANLRVAEDTSLVCCQYCNSELQVIRDGAVLTTRLFEKGVEAIKDDLGQKLDILRLQNEIERLDREWSLKREEFMVRGKHGSSIPSGAGSLIGGLMAAGFGIFWMIFTASMGAPGFSLFGLVFAGIGLVTGVSGMGKASQHESAQSEYQQRRRALLSQLQRAEQESQRPI